MDRVVQHADLLPRSQPGHIPGNLPQKDGPPPLLSACARYFGQIDERWRPPRQQCPGYRRQEGAGSSPR